MSDRPRAPSGQACHPDDAPRSVRALRVLGHGRAAQAVLVEATMPDGQQQTCVEKVFACGWLTRTIYRLSFQAPFAYQTNRDAILSCFFRRRVASAVLAASETGVRIAEPLYVRFDSQKRAWVLAAEWINGRGITPAPADPRRIRRWFSRKPLVEPIVPAHQSEVETLVASMHRLEELFSECGLVGSGWQVAPRAMVSTANLLRESEHYTVIDLESGIPAVLVPKYLRAGARRGELPPFDDLDPERLRTWLDHNDTRLLFRLGVTRYRQLRQDVENLIAHSARWKQSELALLRRPWRLLRRDGLADYRRECVRRWAQDGTVDAATAQELSNQQWRARLIWYAGCLPGLAGRLLSRIVGNRDDRHRLAQCLRDPVYREEQIEKLIRDSQQAWIASQRIPPWTELTPTSFLVHRFLKALTPKAVHRFVADRCYRQACTRQALLLAVSPRYQAWFGKARIKDSIESWLRAQRISLREAETLRGELSGSEVRAYTRGLGAHLALKTLMPVLAPAKLGGLAAFIASGNVWFLLPLLLMPAARTAITLASWWSTRKHGIPHFEALLVGLLPVVGSVAFPLQMFAARSALSTFLIRDAASKLGRRVPVYGGPNSRTEIALIRSTDTLLELFDIISVLSLRLRRTKNPGALQRDGATTFTLPLRTRWGRRLDGLARRQIAQHERQRSRIAATTANHAIHRRASA